MDFLGCFVRLMISFLMIFLNFVSADNLQCYVCNSNYLQCSSGINFDPSIQQTYPCYDQCLKITVYPNFIIRTCTTLLSSLSTPINLTNTNPQAQQCYAGTYTDPLSSLPQSAYFCYCSDKSGCNNSSKLVFDYFVLFAFLFLDLAILSKSN